MEYNLIVRNIGELTNKELVKEIKAIEKLESNTQSNRWKQAEHYATILNDELYSDDFESLTEFAKVIGSTKQTISQLVKAVEYAEECNIDKGLWTINKVYILSLIDNVVDFMSWLKTEHKELNINEKEDLRLYGDNFIKKLVKEYKNSKKPVKEDTEKAIEAEDVTPEKETVNKEDLIKVEFDGLVAYVPKNVLMEYVVEEITEEE